MTDVVYALGLGSRWHDNELRYSLRSVATNVHDLGRVYVVGHKPDWLMGAVHVPADDRLPHNKDGNIIRKVLAACRDESLSEEFLRLSDDQLILRPKSFAEIRPYFVCELSARFCRVEAGNRWDMRLRRTYALLKSRGLTTFNYDSHVPQPFNKAQFQKVMDGCDYEIGIGYTINTLYFNSVALQQHLPLLQRKATIEKPCRDVVSIRQRLQGKEYLGYNDAGLTDELKSVLDELFPSPSRFEAH